MNSSNKSILVFGLLLAAFLMLFIYGILTIRSHQGGGYAQYSSHRTDPLGTRALFDALARTPRLTVVRHQAQYQEIQGGAGDSFFILGLSEGVMEKSDAQALETFMTQGGRVVIAFEGRMSEPFLSRMTREEKEDKEDKEDKKADKDIHKKHMEGEIEGENKGEGEGALTAEKGGEGEITDKQPTKSPEKKVKKDAKEGELPWEVLPKRWGFVFDYEKTTAAGVSATVSEGQSGLPEKLPWHSGMRFKNASSHWRAIYQAGGQPVVMTRDFGRGSLVLISDSYLFSNEALRRDRQTSFLTWSMGDHCRRVIFDEAHLGVIRQDGVMTLARRYRLTGFFITALMAVLLFIWRNATSLAPRRNDEEADVNAGAGLGPGAGLTALMRRSVPEKDLLRACWQAWQRSHPGGAFADGSVSKRVEELLAHSPEGRHADEAIVEQYRAVATALKERKTHRGAKS